MRNSKFLNSKFWLTVFLTFVFSASECSVFFEQRVQGGPEKILLETIGFL